MKEILLNRSRLCRLLIFSPPSFHYFSKYSLRIHFLAHLRPTCCSCRVSLWKCLWAFLFFFSSPFLYIYAPSISMLHPPLIISLTCLLDSLFPFLSQAPCENLRTPSTYPGNMLPHHPGQGNFEDFTCWAGPRWSIKVRVMQPKPPYNKNYSTQGGWGTDAKSNRGTFYMKTDENRQINHDEEFVRGSPKCKKRKKEIKSLRRTFHAALFCVFPLDYCHKGCSCGNLANMDLSFKRQKKLINKGNCTVISP